MKIGPVVSTIVLVFAGLAIVLPSVDGHLQLVHAFQPQTEHRGPVVKVWRTDGTEVTFYEESHALVIGVSDYTNGWKSLPGVKADIVEVRAVLEKHGFGVEVVPNPNRAVLDQAIRTFISTWGQVEKNRLLIYFAGHGKTLTSETKIEGESKNVGMGYIVPADAPLPTTGKGPFKEKAISMEQIQAYLAEAESRHVLLVFDSCFSGSLFNVRSDPAMPPHITADMASPVRQFITSGSGNQEVPDDSTFRKEFVKALEGQGDLNNDGYVTGTELGLFLRERVMSYEGSRQTPQYGKIRKPEFDKGDFVFALLRRVDPVLIEQQKARALASIGLGYATVSEKLRALKHYEGVLQRRREVRDRFGEADALNNIGLLNESIGEYGAALQAYRKALQFWQSVSERRAEALTLNSLGRVFASLEDNQKALENHARALDLFRSLYDRASEATALTNLGAVYLSLGDYGKALDHLEKALPLLKAVDDISGEAIALNNIGRVYASLGDHKRALEYYSLAIPSLVSVGNRPGEAATLLNLGTTYAALSDGKKALDCYMQALALRRDAGDKIGEVDTLNGVARLERDERTYELAREHVEEAINITESLRAKVSSQDLRALYFARAQKSYDLYIDLLMQMGRQSEALHVSESARARALVELLQETPDSVWEGIDPTIRARERALRQQLAIKARTQIDMMVGEYKDQHASTVSAEIQSLNEELDAVHAQILKASPRYAALTQPAISSLQEIQQRVLDADTILLEYALGEERSYLWAVTKKSINAYVLAKRELIEEFARDAYRDLSRGPAFQSRDTAYKLSEQVLGPVASQLGRKRLLIVADGALQYVPFAALPIPNLPTTDAKREGSITRWRLGTEVIRSTGRNVSYRPLIVEHEVVSLPSASTLVLLRREQPRREIATKTVAVFADPVFSTHDVRLRPDLSLTRAPDQTQGVNTSRWEFMRLPWAQKEAAEILSLAPPEEGNLFAGFAANRENVMSPEVSRYKYVHFATHGVFNRSDPDRSAVILSMIDERGTSQNGFLTLQDIYDLRLSAELVVLTSCESGLGKQVRGEGIVGFTRAFLYAGAARVISSLWLNDDHSTAVLMGRFYHSLLKEGLRPGAALRAAQLSMLKDKRWAAPQYWGTFVLQGDW